MNFRKSHPTKTERALTLALSVGFLAFLPGCSLRDSSEPEKIPQSAQISVEKQSASEIIADAFGHSTAVIPSLSTDQSQSPMQQPDFSYLLALPEKQILPEAEEWIFLFGDRSGEVLLTPEEISAYNRRVIEECPTVVDIADPPDTMDGQTVRDMIRKASLPVGAKYTAEGAPIDSAKRQKIEARRDVSLVPDVVTVRRAVIVNRCDMKSVPTSVGFHNSGDRHYSAIQETELITGFPVWILHESSDGNFYFVQSYYYAGWIPAGCAALCTDEEFARYADMTGSGSLYVTVTAPRLDVNGTRLDMGVTLPYLSEDENEFAVELPDRDDGGELIYRRETIPKTSAVLGSLPYTRENYYNQAFAFLGTPYGWGGADGGVDCSGFVCAVFRCFGMYLPRNTGEQSQYNGGIVDLSSMTSAQKYAAFAALDTPSSVHWTGHVMLYLGEKNGSHYVIHAPQGGETVTVMPLNMNNTYICAVSIQ